MKKVIARSICLGDTIFFAEPVWGAYSLGKKKPPLGERMIEAIVEKESYGEKKQQHTFSLRIIHSEGYSAIEKNTLIMRKGRNIYSHNPMRLVWGNEKDRDRVLKDKHLRGDNARRQRDIRKGLLEDKSLLFK